MPETRGERIIFGICTLAITALVALIVLEVTTDRFGARRTPAAALPATTGAATTEAVAPALPPPTTAPEPTTSQTTAVPEPARVPNGVRLTFDAKADTWVEVRSDAADGDVLYSGILPQGSVKRFIATSVWVRFGAASNLTARLNGRPLHLPAGTYSALVDPGGLQPLGG